MRIFAEAELNNYNLQNLILTIKSDTYFGFMYDYDALSEKKFVSFDAEGKSYEVGQIYHFDCEVKINVKDIPHNLDTFIFNFEKVDYSLSIEKIHELYSEFDGNEREIKLSRFNPTIREYYEDFILASEDKKVELASTARSLLIEMRSLKEFKFHQEKYSKQTRAKILNFIFEANKDQSLRVSDEYTVTDYEKLLSGIDDIETYCENIHFHMCEMLFHNYKFYNHDFMMDYNFLKNMKLIQKFDKNMHDFVAKRLYLTLENTFTKDYLGKENTPVYYELLLRYAKRVINEIGIAAFQRFHNEINRLEENLKWFEFSNNRFINFGDCDNYESTQLLVNKGTKMFPDAGYAVYSSDKGFFATKFKTLSIVHTHCDDGSFIWSYLGEQVFIDPGLYKYVEKDPLRKFIRSYFAHNNIAIGSDNIFPFSLNSEILNDSVYKMFASEKYQQKIEIIEDNWENKREILFKNNWFDGYTINQRLQVVNDAHVRINYKTQGVEDFTYSLRFNLGSTYSINEKQVKTGVRKYIVQGKKFDVVFNFNFKVNVKINNNYKISPKEQISKINQLQFYRNSIDKSGDLTVDITLVPKKAEYIGWEKHENIIYKYVNNKSNNLTILFDSVKGTVNDVKNLLSNDVSNLFVDDYSHYNLVKSNCYDTDFLLIHDHFSQYAGWYVVDNNKIIFNDINGIINKIIIEGNYENSNIYTYGSSKGGFASLLYGISNKNIGNVISVVPQIRLKNYFENSSQIWSDYFHKFMATDENIREKINTILFDMNPIDCNVHIFSGVGEYHQKYIVEFMEHIAKKNISVNYYEDSDINNKHNEIFATFKEDSYRLLPKKD